MSLTKEQFLGARKLAIEPLDVPELGGQVFVREMTAAERDRFEAAHIKAPFVNLRARLAAATLCDDQGALLFGPGDVEALGLIPARILDRVFPVASRLSGLSRSDVEDLEKNSRAAPSASSPSG
jgi:hypothetical protein